MDFLNAFQQAFDNSGSGPTPTNMKELLEAGRRWLQGEGDPDNLLAGVQRMEEKVSRNAAATESDLRANPRMEPELREAMVRSEEAYRELEVLMGELRIAVQEGAAQDASDMLDRAEDVAVEIGQLGRFMREWLEAPGARCPRCGSTGPEPWCATCALDRLVPDPAFFQDRRVRTATLPPGFVAVYRQYTAVLEGKAPLADLYEALDALESSLRSVRSNADVLARRMESEPAGVLVANVDDCFAGVRRMRQVETSRSMRDLNQGWEHLFRVGQGMQPAAADVLAEGGRGESAGQVRNAHRTTDMVILEGDD